jgi:hypothetical protein
MGWQSEIWFPSTVTAATSSAAVTTQTPVPYQFARRVLLRLVTLVQIDGALVPA